MPVFRRLRAADPAPASLVIALSVGLPIGVALSLLRDMSPVPTIVTIVAVCTVVGLAAFDLYTRIAPNFLTIPGTLAILAGAALVSVPAGLDALGGAVVLFAAFLIFALIGRGQLGFGDVKAAALCGAITGLRGTMPLLLITFVSGVLVAGFMLVVLKKQRRDTLPFTPLLSLGVLVTIATADIYLAN